MKNAKDELLEALQNEYDVLYERVEKVEQVLDSEEIDKVPQHHVEMLVHQHNAMSLYLFILGQRIAYFTIEASESETYH